MKQFKYELIALFALLSFTFFLSLHSRFVSTGKAISQGSSLPEWAASWAGVPWDVESGDMLITSDFSNGKALITAKGDWVWRTGYIWRNGQWQPFEFPQTSAYDGWAQGSASAEVPLSGDEILDGENYVLAYTCSWKNKWYCGCSTQECKAVYNEDGSFSNEKSTGFEWQLQTFDAARPDGLTQDMSAVLSPDTPAAEKQDALQKLRARAGKVALIDTNSLQGDFNNDEKVDLDDFFLFADAFGKEAHASALAASRPDLNWPEWKFDLNGNYKVDFDDFFIFADNFGKTIGQTSQRAEIDCNSYEAEDKRNGCFMLLAVNRLDKSLCSNIKDSKNAQNEQDLRKYCESKVDVFMQGGLTKPTGRMQGYYFDIITDTSDSFVSREDEGKPPYRTFLKLDVEKLIAHKDTVQFSQEELNVLQSVDGNVIQNLRLNGNLLENALFIIDSQGKDKVSVTVSKPQADDIQVTVSTLDSQGYMKNIDSLYGGDASVHGNREGDHYQGTYTLGAVNGKAYLLLSAVYPFYIDAVVVNG